MQTKENETVHSDEQMTSEDIFKRDYFSRLTHRWTDSGPKFKDIDYQGRRAIERAGEDGYLYLLVHKQSNEIPAAAAVYYEICCAVGRPFVACLAANPYERVSFSYVIADLSPARRVIDHKHFSDLTKLLLSDALSPYAKNENWLAAHPILRNCFMVKDVPPNCDTGLAIKLVEFIEKHSIQDLGWVCEIGAHELIAYGPRNMLNHPDCPVWFRRPLINQKAWEILSIEGLKEYLVLRS
jgi:hypothetical protein